MRARVRVRVRAKVRASMGVCDRGECRQLDFSRDGDSDLRDELSGGGADDRGAEDSAVLARLGVRARARVRAMVRVRAKARGVERRHTSLR